MKAKIEALINDLKDRGYPLGMKSAGKTSPDATVNVWYVIAMLEEILLEEKKKEGRNDV